MRTLDLTLPSPAENLALDEALLLDAEESTGQEILRFWTSPTPFVVVGVSGRVQREVDLAACEARQVPVHRRCSGGGTVVQGPGCLNYLLILRITESTPLKTLSGTNAFVMDRNAQALSNLMATTVRVAGHTDLVIDDIKISGNSQRRLRNTLLFHGTFLLDSDLSLISALLPAPSLQPAYRRGRAHHDFVRNLNLPEARVKHALKAAWEAPAAERDFPKERVQELVSSRYSNREWNFRR